MASHARGFEVENPRGKEAEAFSTATDKLIRLHASAACLFWGAPENCSGEKLLPLFFGTGFGHALVAKLMSLEFPLLKDAFAVHVRRLITASLE